MKNEPIEIMGDYAVCKEQILNNRAFMFVSGGAWFDKGSICWLESNCGEYGLFVGVRNGQLDGELCPWLDFDIYFGRDLIRKALS